MNARKWAGVVLSALLGLFSAAGVSAATWTTGPYVYDGAGNIKSIGSSELYQYDALGRLTYGQIGPGQTQSVQYDRYGNVTSLTTGGTQITIGVDAQTNRITVPANVYANYDDAGRVISTPSGSDAFTYDATDMVMRSTVSGSTNVHIYTVNDERLATLTPGSTEQSEWTVRDPGGRILRRFERSGGTWTWKQDYIYAEDRLLASDVDTSAGTLYYFPDHLGTPRLITGNGGVKVAFHTYYPFGVEATASSPDAEKRKFTGHERDHDSLDYMHARYYRPHWGRFLSVDPVLDVKKALRAPQMWNRYSYVLNNPLRYTDPDGRQTAGMPGNDGDDGSDPDDSGHGMFGSSSIVNVKKIDQVMMATLDKINDAGINLMITVAPIFPGGPLGRTTLGEAKVLVGAWGKGTFPTLAKTIAYHFEKHGADVGAKNTLQYMRKAFEFAKNLRGAEKQLLKGGATRYMKNGRYVDILDGKIVSFGAL